MTLTLSVVYFSKILSKKCVYKDSDGHKDNVKKYTALVNV